MHVAKVISRRGATEYVSYLLRQSYREGTRVRNRTLANLSMLPPGVIEAIRQGLAGETLIPVNDAFRNERSLPHGHVLAALGTARKLGLDELVDPRPSRERDLVVAMVVARVLEPASKLATTRLFSTTTLGPTLGVEEATDDQLYAAMDWLLERQADIEARLARRYLEPGGLALYDLTSTWVEGECCPLAKRGHSRDGRRDKDQIEFGLLANEDGVPVAVEAFAGDTGDPSTFQSQVRKMRERFGISEIVWVADRGMLTSRQLEKLQEVVGASWITALRAPTIRQLVEAGSVQVGLFDTQNLAVATDPRYPGERLVVCHNPLLAEKRARKREDMLQATERELAKVAAMVERGAAGGRAGLRGEAAIGERVGRVIDKYKMAKHFTRTITDKSFAYSRDQVSIQREAVLDGLYVLRTNVPEDRLDAPGVVLAYKSLSHVEQAFRHFKLCDLEVRPIYHHAEPRVRAHLFLCMLSYLVQREMQRSLAPLLFVDETPPERPDPVAPAPRSEAARRKDLTQRTADGHPVHSFKTLLAALGTVVKNWVRPAGAGSGATFEMITEPTPLQQRAFDLLGVSLSRL